MIETEKDKAIVTRSPKRQDLKLWLRSQDGFKLTIDGDWDFNDAVIFTNGREKTEIEQVEVLRKRSFNRHQNWLNAGKELKDWGDGPFHMGNPIVMATWLCGKAGVKTILFADFKPEINKDYQKNLFRKVMRKLVSEFQLDLKYTDLRSQLFKEIGATKVETEEKSSTRNVELPSKKSAFENHPFESEMATIKYNSEAVGPSVSYGSKRFTATDVVPTDPARIPERNLFILNPNDSSTLKKAIKTGKGLYLVNEDIDLSGSMLFRTFYAFAVGEKKVRTEGILGKVSDSEREFMEAAASNNSDITHV